MVLFPLIPEKTEEETAAQALLIKGVETGVTYIIVVNAYASK